METITLSAVLFTGTCSKKFQHFVKGVGGGGRGGDYTISIKESSCIQQCK